MSLPYGALVVILSVDLKSLYISIGLIFQLLQFLTSLTGSGMGAAAVFERGSVVDRLSNARPINQHNLLSKDAK